MPELDFKGKEFVYNHHLAIPHRPLLPHPDQSIGAPRLDGNLIIHGDNLHALKSLLPMYAGKVDCIFIDPPYNTGNEGWCYNDNVNSPMLRDWLNSNPVSIEDGLRHDKWLCMMWPRLRLLHELLAEDGSLWMTLDDNEAHRATAILTEVFGWQNHEATIAWEKRYTRSNNATRFSSSKDYLIVYRKSEHFHPEKETRSQESEESYANPDNDQNGSWITVSYVNPALKVDRPNLVYKIRNPFTGELVEHETNAWKYKEETHNKFESERRLWWGKNGEFRYPRLKVYLKDGIVPIDLWSHEFAGTTDQAFKEVEAIIGRGVFETPKPVKLIQRVIEIGAKSNSIILDSFAGSGTTAHAVLAANAKDGGNRKFILVECEGYADRLTAERIRRVINGYAFSGTQREELHREKLTFTSLKKADKLLDHIESIKNLDGHRFDNIKAEVKDGELIVTGEKAITERTEGLGGSFTFCTLGDAIEMDKLLTGEALPTFEQLGALLFHTATNEIAPNPLPTENVEGCDYLGESKDCHIWLIYQPDLEFLKSREAALTLIRAKALVKAKPGKVHRVFAPAKFVSQKLLKDADLPVEFVPLPFALYRIERD